MNGRLAVFISLLCLMLIGAAFAQTSDDGYTIHVVQRGENLFRIALNYGLTTDELAAINGITNPASIQVGQRLLVPNSELTTVDRDPVDILPHTVQPGETFDVIATLYGVTLDDVLAVNPDFDPGKLTVGQLVLIPENAPPPIEADDTENEQQAETPLTVPSTNVVHAVQAGETLFRIATQYGLTVNELAAANAITDPTRITVGQQLIIPGVEPPQLASTLPSPVTALYMSPQVLIEGKTGYLEIRTDGAAAVVVTAQFLERSLQAVPVATGVYRVFVGIPVFTEPGVYPLILQIEAEGATDVTTIEANVQIVRGPYGNETITLIDGRDNLLNTNVENAELELLQRVVAPFTVERFIQDKMSLPAAAAITSNFGTRRSYNGGAFDRYHSGTDFAGVPGTPILAPAPGRVVLADTLNIRGNATVIEHGWGIYTGYWHQTEIYVGLGDIVETGQIIGTIGSTGRVTGAHLHWELWVNGVAVDPMQWVQQAFVMVE